MRAKANFSAIIAGTIVVLGFGTLFMLLGNALGLGMVNLVSPTAGAGLKAGTWIYGFATLCASFYIGGHLTTRLGMPETRDSAVVHGLTTWGLSLIVAAMSGFLLSPAIARTILGSGSNEANWLLLFVAAVGCMSTVLGSLAAHANMRPMGLRPVVEEERVEFERKSG